MVITNTLLMLIISVQFIFNVVKDQPFKAFHDHRCSSYWAVVDTRRASPRRESSCGNCRALVESSSKRVAFNSLYLFKYFGMVTMKQKGGNCIQH